MDEQRPSRFECGDVIVRNDDGQIIFSGPRFLRCGYAECNSLVTHGMIQEHGGCVCGGKRVRQAVKVTPDEEEFYSVCA